MRKEGSKKIETSNIVKLIFICAITVGAVLLLRNWYLKSQELENGVPILPVVLTHQIKENELYNYVHDTDTAIVYMCVSTDKECRTLEKNMKPLVQKNSWEDDIIYLDLKDISDISKFYQELYSHYQLENKIEEYPTIIYFENANVHSVLSGKNITIQKVEEFLKGILLL